MPKIKLPNRNKTNQAAFDLAQKAIAAALAGAPQTQPGDEPKAETAPAPEAKPAPSPEPERPCGLTDEEFNSLGGALVLSLGGRNIEVPARIFSTGSLGWYGTGKAAAERRKAELVAGGMPEAEAEAQAEAEAYPVLELTTLDGKRVSLTYDIKLYVRGSKPTKANRK